MAVEPVKMTAATAKRLVIVGVIGAGVLAAIAQYRKGETPSPRIAVGVVASGVILSALAEVTPDIAGAFGLIILGTSAFVVGGDAWASLADVTKGGNRSRPGGKITGAPEARTTIPSGPLPGPSSPGSPSRPTSGGQGGGGGGGGSW